MRRRPLALAAALTALMLAGPAEAATSVGIGTATRDGDTLTVAGTSGFSAQPYLVVGTDAAGDAPTGLGENGGDLVSAQMATLLDGRVQARFVMSAMVSGLVTSPIVTYGWNMCASGGSCYEVHVTRFTTDPQPGPSPQAHFFRCGDAACSPAQQTKVGYSQAAIIPESKSVTATFPSTVGIAPGSTITPLAVDATGPVFTVFGTEATDTMQRGTGDGLAPVAAFTVASKQVSVALGDPGLDPASLTYGDPVSPAEDGSWIANLDVTGMSGARTLYARACFGANNCAYGTSTVTL